MKESFHDSSNYENTNQETDADQKHVEFLCLFPEIFLNSQISQVEQELEQPEDRFDEKNQELSENNTIEKDSDTPDEYSNEKEDFEKKSKR